jgi:hypothetical protein
MQEAFDQMTMCCQVLTGIMQDRGMILPSASIEARSGFKTARVMLNYAAASSDYPDKYEFMSADTVAEALEKAERWILAQPTAEERAKKNALELTAKALEAMRIAGFDDDAGVAFVAQLEAAMIRLSENALTDQREPIEAPPYTGEVF